ncbi:MAG: conjugal transfer protein TraH [Pseudomonadota bacterium]
MRRLICKLAAWTMIVVFAFASAAAVPADLNAEMQQMFNDLGTIGNVTEPGAFRGQAMNLYTGGSMMMRTPGKNYSLAQIQLPSTKAGCGGIDVFGGSFSFVNKEQFVSLLKNIGANAVGYAFNLALCSISPDICNQLKYLQDQINKMNAMNINSCEAAQSMVNGMVGEYDNAKMSGCANISQYLGSVTDRNDARFQCATNATSVTKAASSSTDPNVSNATYTQGNLVWIALEKVADGLSQEEKELIMSITGTYILFPAPDGDAVGAQVEYKEPKIVGLRDLLLGKADVAAGMIKVSVWKCDDSDCMTMNEQTMDVEPFVEKVRKTLIRISDNIRNRSPQLPADIGFINTTSEPVYLLLSVANTRRDSGAAESLIERYKTVIALDYAETFLFRVIDQARTILSHNLKRNETEARYAKEITDNVARARAEIRREKEVAYSEVRTIASFSTDLQMLQRQMWTSMPMGIRSLLDFGASANGKL